jgi:hypothetical protein
VWRLKYLFIGMLPAIVIGVALYLLAPAMADELRQAVRDTAQDAVREVFADHVPDTVEPGQIVVTEADFARVIMDSDRREDSWNVDDIDVIIEDGMIRIVGQDDSNDDAVDVARTVPVIENGRLELTEFSGVLSIFKSAQEAIANQIELETEELFLRSGVVPVSITAENGRLVIVTEPADGSSSATQAPGDATPEGLFDNLGLRTPTAES